MESGDQHIVLFDGICNLCNNTVQFILKRDTKGIFRFASLQSDIGQKLLADHGLDHYGLTSFVYLFDNKAYTKSDAALQIARQLGGGWKLVSYLRIIPKFIRDAVYTMIARNRYRWFGKREECMVPTKELKGRFL